MYKTLKDLNALNIDVMLKVMKDLIYYNETHVIYQNKKFEVSTGIMLCDKYPDDYKFIGSFKASDIYPDMKERESLRIALDTIEHRICEILFTQPKNSRPYPKEMLQAITTANVIGRGY